MIAYRLFHLALLIVTSIILVPDTVGDGELSSWSGGRFTPETHRQTTLVSSNLSPPLPSITAFITGRYIWDEDTATSVPEENDGEARIVTPSPQLYHFLDTKSNTDLGISYATKDEAFRTEASNPDGQLDDLPANPRNWNYDQAPKRIDASSVTKSSSVYFNAVKSSDFDAVVCLGCVCLLMFCLAIVVFFWLYTLCQSRRRHIQRLESVSAAQQNIIDFDTAELKRLQDDIDRFTGYLSKYNKVLERSRKEKREAEEVIQKLRRGATEALKERSRHVEKEMINKDKSNYHIGQSQRCDQSTRRQLDSAQTNAPASTIYRRTVSADEIDHKERQSLSKTLEQVDLMRQERDAARCEVVTATTQFNTAREDLESQKALALKLVIQVDASQKTITWLQDSLSTSQDVVRRTTEDLLQEKNTTIYQLSAMQDRIDLLQERLALSEQGTRDAQRQGDTSREEAAPAREILEELHSRLAEAENTVGRLREERDGAQKKTSEMSVRMTEIQAELASSKAKIELASKQEKRWLIVETTQNEKIDTLVAGLAKLTEDIPDLRKTAHEVEVVRTQLEAEKDKNLQLLRQLDQSEQALAIAKSTCLLSPPVSAPLYDSAPAHEPVSITSAKVQDTHREVEKSLEEATPASDILEELRSKLAEAENSVTALREERDTAQKTTSEMSVRMAAIQEELASSKSLASKQENRRRKAEKIQNEKLDNLVAGVAKLTEDNTDARKTAHDTRQFEPVRIQLEAEKDKNVQLLRELERYEEALTTALATAKVASLLTPPVSAPLYDNVPAPEPVPVPATPAEIQTLNAAQHLAMASSPYDPATSYSGYQNAPPEVPCPQSQHPLPNHESQPVTASREWQSAHLSREAPAEAPATQHWNAAFNTTPNIPHPTKFPQAGSTPFAPFSIPNQYNVNNFNFAGTTSHQFHAGVSAVNAEADTEMEIQNHNVAHPSISNVHWQAPPVTSEAQPAVPVPVAMNSAALQAPQQSILWAVQQALGQVPSGQTAWNAYSVTNGNDGQEPMAVNQFGQSPFGAANSTEGQQTDVPRANTFSNQEFGSFPPPSGSVASSVIPSAASARPQEFGPATAQVATATQPSQNGTATFGTLADSSYGSTFTTNSAVLQHPQPAAVWPAQQSLMSVVSSLARWNAHPEANGGDGQDPMVVNQVAQPSFGVAGSTEGQAEVSTTDISSASNQEFEGAPPPSGPAVSSTSTPTPYDTPHENGLATVGTTMDPNQAPVANGFGFASNDSPVTDGRNGQPSFGGASSTGGQQPGESTTTTVSNPEFESVPPLDGSATSDPVPPSTSRNTPLEADQAVEQAETSTPTRNEYELVSRGAGLDVWVCGEFSFAPQQTLYFCLIYLQHRLPDVPSYIWDAVKLALVWTEIDITRPNDPPESISWENLWWCSGTLQSTLKEKVPAAILSDIANAVLKGWMSFYAAQGAEYTTELLQPEPGDQEGLPPADGNIPASTPAHDDASVDPPNQGSSYTPTASLSAPESYTQSSNTAGGGNDVSSGEYAGAGSTGGFREAAPGSRSLAHREVTTEDWSQFLNDDAFVGLSTPSASFDAGVAGDVDISDGL